MVFLYLFEGYVAEMGRAYSKEIQDFLEQLKSNMARKPQEDHDFRILFLKLVFAGPIVTVSSAAQNVIKSAIKAGKDGQERLAIKQKLEGLRSRKNILEVENSASVHSADMDDIDDKMQPDEAVGHALLKLAAIMVREQNFLMDFFGIIKKPVTNVLESSLELDTMEEMRTWQESLNAPHELFKDPKAEKRIMELLTILFEIDILRESLLNLIDLGLKQDMTQCVGMMVHIEFYLRDYHNTCHFFIVSLLECFHKRVETNFEKFINEQIKGIEDSKVTSKKRNGVLPFMKTFPKFVDRMEKMLSNWDGTTRKTVDRAYAKLIKCMFETLDQCAQQFNTETKNALDEKESLNIHILTVENMHHFYTETRARKVPGLEEHVKQAKFLYDMNLEMYCKVVIRKPLGKLLV